jgi:hypothetical protein
MEAAAVEARSGCAALQPMKVSATVHWSMGENDMDRFIAQANVDEFKRLLKIEKDDARRHVLLQLLADEEQKLAAALDGHRKKDV